MKVGQICLAFNGFFQLKANYHDGHCPKECHYEFCGRTGIKFTFLFVFLNENSFSLLE